VRSKALGLVQHSLHSLLAALLQSLLPLFHFLQVLLPVLPGLLLGPIKRSLQTPDPLLVGEADLLLKEKLNVLYGMKIPRVEE
jgi:hypothetical protein